MVAAQARAGEGRQLEAEPAGCRWLHVVGRGGGAGGIGGGRRRVRHRAGSAGVRRDENRARDGAREQTHPLRRVHTHVPRRLLRRLRRECADFSRKPRRRMGLEDGRDLATLAVECAEEERRLNVRRNRLVPGPDGARLHQWKHHRPSALVAAHPAARIFEGAHRVAAAKPDACAPRIGLRIEQNLHESRVDLGRAEDRERERVACPPSRHAIGRRARVEEQAHASDVGAAARRAQRVVAAGVGGHAAR